MYDINIHIIRQARIRFRLRIRTRARLTHRPKHHEAYDDDNAYEREYIVRNAPYTTHTNDTDTTTATHNANVAIHNAHITKPYEYYQQ